MGASLSISGISRLGSALSILGYSGLGSTVSVRSFARLGSAMAVHEPTWLGSSMSVRTFSRLGSSLSVIGFGRLGSAMALHHSIEIGAALSLRSLNRVSSLSLVNFANVGSSLSLRSFLRVGSTLSLLRHVQLGASFSVLGFDLVGSSLSLRGFGRVGASLSVLDFAQLGSSLSCRRCARFGNDVSLVNTPSVTIGSDAKIEFVDPTIKWWAAGNSRLSLTSEGGIIHGIWSADAEGYNLGSNAWSDRRLKANIQPIMAAIANRTVNSSVSLLNMLRPVAYNMQSDPARIRFGFIADEMQQVLPEVVRYTGAGEDNARAGIMYLDLLAVLACSIQELTLEMNLIVERLSAVEERIQRRKMRSLKTSK